MRRIRRITIQVSEGFYNMLEKERANVNVKLNKKMGIPKNLTITNFTEMLANQRAKIPKLNISAFKNVKKKRGCI